MIPTDYPTVSPAQPARTIGFSRQKRPIVCVQRGSASAPLRVLVLAGQHGDERRAQRTAQSLLEVPAEEVRQRLPFTELAVVPQANPDGCATRSRCNADGVDLNRDHQLLLARETAAIHNFVGQWQPHVILDLHNYPSRRRHLLARNVVLAQDVFMDVPSHPAILCRPGGVDPATVLEELLETVIKRNVCAARYILVASSGRARHSTPDVVDARNGLALRYGALTILIENRQPRRDETATDRRHLQLAQDRALWAALEWLDRKHTRFARLMPLAPPALGAPVPVDFKYAEAGHRLRLLCRDADHGRRVYTTFSRYSHSVGVRRTVPLPLAYAVPRGFAGLSGVLRRHGFVTMQCPPGQRWLVEKQRIEHASPSRRPNRPPRKLVLTAHRVIMDLDDYEIFLTQQSGGDALAVFLEPESKHGLHRFLGVQVPLVASSWYPVFRVLEVQANGLRP